MDMQEPGKLLNVSRGLMVIANNEPHSYQNAVGSARKVVQLVEDLGAPGMLQAKL